MSDLEGSLGFNLFSIDAEKKLIRHTFDGGSRDMDFALDDAGNLAFTSNRIIDREAYKKTPAINRREKRQYFNLFYMPKGVLEVTDQQDLAQPLTSGVEHAVPASISPDGNWVATIRQRRLEDNSGLNVLVVVDMKNGRAQQELLQAEMILGVEWSSDSRTLLYSTHVKTEGGQGKNQLLSWNAADKTTKVLLENPLADTYIASPQWSRDGAWVSFVAFSPADNGRKLHIFNVKTGAVLPISENGVAVESPVSWSSDSKKVLYSGLVGYKMEWNDETRSREFSGSGQIFMADTTGKIRQVTQGDKKMHMRPVFSPDDQRMAYLYTEQFDSRTSQLQIADLDGKLISSLYDAAITQSKLLWR